MDSRIQYGGALVLALCLGLLVPSCLVREPVSYEPPIPTSEAQVSRRWHANGKRSYEQQVLLWSDGRLERHGTTRTWYKSGQLRYERFYVNDEACKLWRSWFESGALQSEAELADGKTLSPMRFYYESGQLAASGDGIGGSRQGPWSYWHPNGQLSEQGEYRDMAKVGVWRSWGQDGLLLGGPQ